jgi:hypothetical protein
MITGCYGSILSGGRAQGAEISWFCAVFGSSNEGVRVFVVSCWTVRPHDEGDFEGDPLRLKPEWAEAREGKV